MRAIRPSSLASAAPRQKWIPCPNAMCGFGFRVMSKRFASGRCAVSRLADPTMTSTKLFAGIVRPCSFTSRVVCLNITCPGDRLKVPNDPGLCSAKLDPGTATAKDICDPNPVVTFKRSDGKTSLSDPYPVGQIVKGDYQSYGVFSPPATFFINAQGVVVASFTGPLDTQTIDHYLGLIA